MEEMLALFRARGVDVDDVTAKYAEKLQDIYDLRLAGDSTFVGVLAEFLRELVGE